MRTRSVARSEAAAPRTLVSLPDEELQQVISACRFTGDGAPLFEVVKGLGCLSKRMRQQLHRLQPVVGVRSLAVVQRPNHDPWRVTLLYEGDLTAAVLEQARQGRVCTINASLCKLHPTEAERVVTDLLGAGGSLFELDLSGAGLKGTWAAIFGEVPVRSAVLRALYLNPNPNPNPNFNLNRSPSPSLSPSPSPSPSPSSSPSPSPSQVLRALYLNLCKLSGPLPELRLPALQVLDLSNNQWAGGLEPLSGCTALQSLRLSSNEITGTLAPLQGLTGLTELNLAANRLTGSLEPLRPLTRLRLLLIPNNRAMRRGLTGGLEPLRGCTELACLFLPGNTLTGSLGPLQSCARLRMLDLRETLLAGTQEEKAHLQTQCHLFRI